MIPAENANHVAEAAALLTERFRSKPVIQAFLAGHVRQLQELEGVFFDIIDTRLLATAAGIQLDTIGRLVKEPRRGRSDDIYRNGIGIKIRVLRSKGRITDIIDIATLSNAPNTPLGIENFRYLCFQVDVVLQVGERYLADYLSQARAASSYGNLIASDLDYGQLLTFDDANDPDATLQSFGDAISGDGLVAASVYGLPPDLTGVRLIGTEDPGPVTDWGEFGAHGTGDLAFGDP